MNITATKRCQLDGRIYDVGDSLDYDGPITSRIAYNFMASNGAKLTVGKDADKQAAKPAPVKTEEEDESVKVEAVLKTMNREQIMAKLDDFGITYKPTHKTDYLAKMLLRAQGVID